jgi:hypothetical protein
MPEFERIVFVGKNRFELLEANIFFITIAD